MHPLRMFGGVLVVIAFASIVAGGSAAAAGGEFADNVCGSAEDCAGRDHRADTYRDTGMALLIGGFASLAVAALCMAAPARMPAET